MDRFGRSLDKVGLEQAKVDMSIKRTRKNSSDVGSFALEQWSEIWAGNRTGEMAVFVQSERTSGMCRANFSRYSVV